MKNILVGFIMDGKGGGIDKYLLNMLEMVREQDVKIDFLTNEVDVQLQQKLHQYNATIYPIANLKHPRAQYRQVKHILYKNNYDIVYLNISTAIDCIAAWAAKNSPVKRVILHSHTSGNDCEYSVKRIVLNVVHAVCKQFLWRFATDYWSCSMRAAQWMFPKKIIKTNQVELIYNAIDEQPFLFDEGVRQDIRKELGIEEKLVVGHVGNFCYQKNHNFLLHVFQALVKIEKDACLLLIGKGHKFEKIKQLASTLGIEEQVHFLGYRPDIAKLMQGMDVFVIPSRFEGFPFVCVEAQYAGLPCVASDVLSPEVKITDAFSFLSLNQSFHIWAKTIHEQGKKERSPGDVYAQADHYRLQEQKEQLIKLLL